MNIKNYISKDLNHDLKSTSISDLGEASIVKIYKDKTIIIGGNADSNEINITKDKIRALLNEEPDNYEKVRYEL